MNLFKKLFIIALIIVLIAGFIWFFIYYHNAKENNAKENNGEIQKSLSGISCVITDFRFEKSLTDEMVEDPLNVREFSAYYDMNESDAEYVASHPEEYDIYTLHFTVVNNSITVMDSVHFEITDSKDRNIFFDNTSFSDALFAFKKGETFKGKMCLLIHRRHLNREEIDALIRKASIVVKYRRSDAFYKNSEDYDQVTFIFH